MRDSRLGHTTGRRKVTERQRPRKGKRSVADHADKYSELPMESRLADLIEHFESEERADEHRD